MTTRKFCPYCMSPLREGEPCPVCGLTEGSYAPLPHHLPPGTVLMGRYLIGRVLGEGGFGITYIGCDLRLEMKVAVKEFFPTERVTRMAAASLDVTSFTGASEEAYQKSKEKFLREARTMANMVKQPEVVGVRDYFEANNTAYIVMEYIEGTTLKELVDQRGGHIPAGECLHIIEPIFHALDVMHEKRLIHRDISPDNLMLENGHIRLLDFGCARENVGDASKSLTIALKYGYAPIEQYQSKGQGPWTDVYALAATIYFCLTGKVPPQSLDRLIEDELILPRNLGVALTEKQEKALLYGMGIRPRQRFQSMREFHAALYEGFDWEEYERKRREEEERKQKEEEHKRKKTGTGTEVEPPVNGGGGTKTEVKPPVEPPPVEPPAEPAWRTWLKSHRAAVGAAALALAAIVLVAAVVRSIGSGADTTDTDTLESSAAAEEVSEDTAAEVRAEMEALFADAQTFTGGDNNWEDFVAMLNDDSVSAVIIPEGTELTFFEQVTITKPVLVEEDAWLGAWDTLTLDGENACIYVKGEFSPTSLLRTINGGRIVLDEYLAENLDENGVLGTYNSGVIWLESESDLVNLGGRVQLQDDQIVTCSERELRSKSTEVSTAEELTAALNGQGTEAITVVGDITVDAGTEQALYVPVPLIIDAGASLTVTGSSNGWDGHLFLNANCLINYGTLNAFVNYGYSGEMGILDNEYGASWTGGTFDLEAVLVNYGDMTVTQTNSCAKGSGKQLGKTGHFFNEGTFTVADGDFYVNSGIFCNTNSGTIIVDTSFTLMNGVTATNYGSIQVESSGYWYTDTLLMNYGGTVEVATGGQLGNSGVLLNWSGGNVRSSGTVSNNGLILTAEDASFTASNRPGGRIETIAALDSTPSSAWTTVSTAEELQAAMADPSISGVFFNNTGDSTVSGNLTVTKPLVVVTYGLHATGTLTVASGYIVAADAGAYAQNIDLADDTFLFCNRGFAASNVNIGQGASLYYAFSTYSDMESDWYGDALGNDGQVTIDGGTLEMLSPLTLTNADISIRNGGMMEGCGYTIFEGCTVDIDADSSLYLTAYCFDANTTVTNNGYMHAETGSPIDFRLEGTFINNGTAELYGMEVSGLLENNGQITCTGNGTTSAGKPFEFYTVDGGEIRGNEILTYTNGMD